MSLLPSIPEKMLGFATQTRFCAVFLDKETLLPIVGLPIYAEAILTAIPSMEGIKINDNLKPQIDKVLKSGVRFSDQQEKFFEEALLSYLTKNYGQPGEEDMKTIIDHILREMLNSKNDLTKDYSEKKVKEIIEAVITKLIENKEISPADLDKYEEPVKYHIPFGYLATDQVGYISFDIEKAINNFKDLQHTQISFEYWMYPHGDLNDGINISDLGRLTTDYIFGNIKLANYQKKKPNVSYHSLQNPGLTDWYLSPSSFSINPQHFVGEDGCEKLYPANFATSEFRFFQIVRGNEVESNQDNLPIRSGFAYEYITSWQPLGHTLGQIIYSLPLAPGEVVKIGIIDWRRSSEDTRTEDTSESEDLTHNTVRDRNISETVQGALREWQRGGTIMGGNSGGAGVSFGIPIIGATAGNAHSFGGGYSTSSGNRDVTVDTVQQVNDAFSQHSSAIRELRSTVVVTSDQQEYARAETRVIANNNHSHALTMLYYEVLRHFKVTTQCVRKRNVLLVDYSRWKIDFNDEYVINQYRKILEESLLEPRYLLYFDAIHIYLATITETNYKNNSTPDIVGEENIEFSEFQLTFEVAGNGMGNSSDDERNKDENSYSGNFFRINLITDRGSSKIMEWQKDGYTPNLRRKFAQGRIKEILCVSEIEPLKWREIKEFELSIVNNGDEKILLSRLTIQGTNPNDGYRLLFNERLNISLEDDADATYEVDDTIDPNRTVKSVLRRTIGPAIWSSPPKPQAYDLIQPPERMNIDILKRHLLGNASYYWRMIWLNQDVNDRADWMDDVTIDGGKLIDKIENRPIDVLGNYVVFPSNYVNNPSSEEDRNLYQFSKAKTEKLMTLPSRGVFGEAKLGNCNASEVIDNTRFWDWQQSPILEKAPEIDPISTESRNVTQNLTPTAFPSSIVNIVNPTAAPDPTGMAGALNLLGKSDIFRNMSMSTEVNDLLKKLSDNAVSMAQAANQARGILQKENGDNSGGGSSSGSGSSGNQPESTTPNSSTPVPTQEEKESKTLDNTEKKLDLAKKNLTPKQQQKVREKVTEDLTKIDRDIRINLKTQDGGGVVTALEPADYDIHQEQGKIEFKMNVGRITTKYQNETLHLKLNGKLPPIEHREYLDMIPGFSDLHQNFYFDTLGSFNFPDKKESISMSGIVTMDASTELTFYVDVNGKVSANSGGEVKVALPADLAHFTYAGKVEAEVGGQVGSKITFKVSRITGMKLQQD